MSDPSSRDSWSLATDLEGRVDMLCDRFEAAWRAGQCPRLEDYLAEMGAAGAGDLLAELIPLDIAYRRRRGEEPNAADYQGRFPGLDPAWLARITAELPGVPPSATPSARDAGARKRSIPPEGRMLGKFRLRKRVGAGSFGAVWWAYDTELGRAVAVKVPHDGLLETPEVRERFAREARAAAQLRHPGIVTVHEVATIDGRPVLVSEFVDGVSLRELLRERRPTFAGAAALVARVAEALDYAHGMGVVHRDIKPANILLVSGEWSGGGTATTHHSPPPKSWISASPSGRKPARR